MKYRPKTAKPLNEPAEILLRGPSSLTSAEREMIASYISHQNKFPEYQDLTEAPKTAQYHQKGSDSGK